MMPVSKMPPATPGTAAPLPAGTPETPASPFDVILSLESLAATNVFNKDGVNSQFTDPYGIGQTSRQYIPPRQVIGTIAYSF